MNWLINFYNSRCSSCQLRHLPGKPVKYYISLKSVEAHRSTLFMWKDQLPAPISHRYVLSKLKSHDRTEKKGHLIVNSTTECIMAIENEKKVQVQFSMAHLSHVLEIDFRKYSIKRNSVFCQCISQQWYIVMSTGSHGRMHFVLSNPRHGGRWHIQIIESLWVCIEWITKQWRLIVIKMLCSYEEKLSRVFRGLRKCRKTKVESVCLFDWERKSERKANIL